MSRILFTIVCASLAVSVWGQTTGTIVGKVLDPTGAAVPSAVVVAINDGTQYQRSVAADSTGAYVMPAMPVGSYTVSAAHPGFTKVSRAGVALTVDQNARVDLELPIGQTQQTLEVSETVSQVDTREATVSQLMDQKRMIDLPLNGRNPAALIALVPGVASVYVPTRPGISGEVIRMNGSNGTAQQFLLDGAPFNAVQRSDGLPLPPPDVVQEFRVQTSDYSAEFGRNAGGLITTITKSGTNQLHGAAWEFLRNDKLDARGFFDPTTPPLRQNQFGFTLGGPVVVPHFYNGHNKTFFFGSYQGLRIREVALVNSAIPATSAEKSGNFSADKAAPLDPLTGQPFPGGIIPQNRFDPAAVKVLARLPMANTPDGRYQQLASQPTNDNQYMIKIDQQIGSKNTLSVKFWSDRGGILQPWEFGSDLPWSPGVFDLFIYNGSINDTHIFSPHLINQAIYAYTRRDEERFNTVDQNAASLGIAITQPTQPFLPTISVTGRFTLGVQINGQPTKFDNVQSFGDTLSWIHGAHTLKFGFSRESSLFQGVPQFDNGNFTFSGQVTGNALADVLIGKPVSFTQQKGRTDDDTTTYWGFFAQDEIRISPRLNLSLGLRYQYDTRLYQRLNHEANFMPGVQSRTYPQAPAGLVYPGDPGLDRSLYNSDPNNFAPRIGIAWDVFGDSKTSLRAGYGLFYQLIDMEIANLLGANPPFSTSVALNNPYSFSAPWQGRYQGGVNDPIATFNPNPTGAVFALPLTLYSMDPNMRNGYVEQYNVSIQHQFPADTLFQVAYVGNSGRKLNLGVQANPAIPGPGATVANTNARRTYSPGVYAGIFKNEGAGNSNYNSLQVSLNKRLSHNVAGSMSYTWSHDIDFYDAEAALVSVSNPYNINADRGPASFDVRHAFNGSLIYQPSVFLSNPNPLVRGVLGGWELSGLWSAQTGSPIAIATGRDNSLTGVGSDRPNIVGNPVLSKSRSRQQLFSGWFYPAAFAANGPGQFGDLGRNAVYGPGLYNIDFSMLKTFHIKERHQIQFRSEFFNVLNHANLNNPVGTFYSPNFGRILSAGSPRLIQLALRYSF